jgi:hypothetical protein
VFTLGQLCEHVPAAVRADIPVPDGISAGDLVLPIIRLPNMKMMPRMPLMSIKGTTYAGSTVPIKKYASNPRTAIPAKIKPNVLMTSSFELIPNHLQRIKQGQAN